MNWYQANSKIFLTQFATYPNVGATSRSTPNMETEQHPPQQSSSMAASMHDEGLPPHAQSYEFTPQFMPQPHHHQQDYKYNLKFFSANGEDFMSNLMGTDLRTLESLVEEQLVIPSLASFHQSMTNSSSTNDFVQEEPVVVPSEQVEPQQHGRVHRQSTRNRQPPRCGSGGPKRY